METNKSTPEKEYISDLLNSFSQQLTALRQEACLSQGQAAAKLGLSARSHLAAIESGRVIPRLDTFLRILSLYGYSITITKYSDSIDQLDHLED